MRASERSRSVRAVVTYFRRGNDVENLVHHEMIHDALKARLERLESQEKRARSMAFAV
jgi:hypothetical protein